MAKHLTQEFNKVKKLEDHAADAITRFCGQMSFVYIHVIWFGLWVIINVGLFAFFGKFDPFPFGLLTLIVSLEAIFLSTFVMISQNRSVRQSDLRAELDYQTDVKAEQEIEQIIGMLKDIHAALALSTPDDTPLSEHVSRLSKLIAERKILEEKMGEEAAKPLGQFSQKE